MTSCALWYNVHEAANTVLLLLVSEAFGVFQLSVDIYGVWHAAAKVQVCRHFAEHAFLGQVRHAVQELPVGVALARVVLEELLHLRIGFISLLKRAMRNLHTATTLVTHGSANPKKKRAKPSTR